VIFDFLNVSRLGRAALIGGLLSGVAGAALAQQAPAQSAAAPGNIVVAQNDLSIVVTARRREESAQNVPIALSVITEAVVDKTGLNNINLLTQAVPSLQVQSPNARNTAITIRGLGVSPGLTNDGLEQGVGLYVDQVYVSRPGIATLDFNDIDRIEILRGPQGTLFGKNTTAGALNITSRPPSAGPEAQGEVSYGSYNFVQAKATVSGPLAPDLSARLSAVGAERDGVIRNVTVGHAQNAQRGEGVRGELQYAPGDKLKARLYADYSNQNPDCCTQSYLRVGATLKPANQQYAALAAGLNYRPASTDIYDRLADVDGKLGARQTAGGISAIIDYDLGAATLTSVSAYREWSWLPANDRDYTRLDITRQSANPSQQVQRSQELRLASNGRRAIDWTAGLYYFNQLITTHGITQYGAQASYWLLPATNTPSSLLDGYTALNDSFIRTDSYAGFGEANWNVTDRLHVTGGLRYTTERKFGAYVATTFGGLATSDATLLSRRLGVSRPQNYTAGVNEGSTSGRANISYDVTGDIHAYASYAKGFKSGGINMAGLPTTAAGLPSLVNAVVKPERVTTYELGLKTQLLNRLVLANLAVFATDDRDYQANVVDSGPGALRGYLANADKVTVSGAELDLSTRSIGGFTAYGNLAYADGKYASFKNGPCPLEKIGASTAACDLSGLPLPGLSRWAGSLGAEYRRPASLGGLDGDAYIGVDANFRTRFNGDATASRYTWIEGYELVNLRLGYKTKGPWEGFISVKNLLDRDYVTVVTVQSGNSGLVVGSPGDGRTVSVTLRARF
jgi:iron complex outermembrane receptor protein